LNHKSLSTAGLPMRNAALAAQLRAAWSIAAVALVYSGDYFRLG